MYDDHFINKCIANINVSSIVDVTTREYAGKFNMIDQLLSDYMEKNGLTPESSITCQNCIDLFSQADAAMYKIMTACLTKILTQVWFELSQNAQDASDE